MIKYLLSLVIGGLLLNISVNGQILDIPPNGKATYRAQEGGAVKVRTDTSSSLENLINKLGSNWQFEETGKAYWIGYTNDMYSIASYGDSAISPLLDYFHATKSEWGKLGVIYCLHLIGIESKIVGRFVETFKSKPARDALLTLVKNREYTETVVPLLARDPWKSDLPILIGLLKENKPCIELINALFRYTAIPFKDNDLPFRQTIPGHLDSINVFLQDSTGIFRVGTLIKLSEKEARKAEQSSVIPGNVTIVSNNIPGVIVQMEYGGSRIFRKFIVNTSEIYILTSYFDCQTSQLNKGDCESLNQFLYQLISLSWEKLSPFSYCDYWDPFQHFVERNNLVICTPAQSAKRWLEYFKNEDIVK